MQKRKFSREFKLSVLNEIDSGKPMVQVCRQHDLASTLVTRWKREYGQNPKEAFAGNGHLWKMEAKNAELERTIGELYLENSFLKKANKRLQEFLAEVKKNGK